MKVLSKLNILNKTIFTLEGDVLELNATKVVINDKEYDFDIAYDMENTIAVNCNIEDCHEVEFI